jgi:hypothetical protein
LNYGFDYWLLIGQLVVIWGEKMKAYILVGELILL